MPEMLKEYWFGDFIFDYDIHKFGKLEKIDCSKVYGVWIPSDLDPIHQAIVRIINNFVVA